MTRVVTPDLEAVMPHPVADHPQPGMHIPGWTTPAELAWLAEQAATMGSVAVIGVLYGRSAFAVLTACPGPVYCIDPWTPASLAASTGHTDVLPEFLSYCGEFRNLRVVRIPSPDAAQYCRSVDMTFIDADHEYDAVGADIDAWLPKTRRLICGHDYMNPAGGWKGVTQAVNERFPAVDRPADELWAVRL